MEKLVYFSRVSKVSRVTYTQFLHVKLGGKYFTNSTNPTNYKGKHPFLQYGLVGLGNVLTPFSTGNEGV